MSAGGFSVESDVEFPQGATHLFRFTAGERRTVDVVARSVHSRALPATPGGEARYVSGFEFVHNDASTVDFIDSLVSAASSVPQFD
jgi:hypothetical protein